MMKFREIKDKIIEILGSNANGRFQTIGYQRQNKNAAEVLGILRTVQVYYFSGDFPKGKSGLTGPAHHAATFRVELTVASDAVGDLATIKSGASTLTQKAAKLLSFQSAAERCDCSIDEFIEIVYQILMDGRNLDVGMEPGQVSDRWIGRIEKDDIEDKGEYVTLTAAMDFSLSTEEEILGDTGGISGTTYKVTLDINGDDVEQTAKEGTLGGA
ncbi:hypothetical protein KAR10_07350 [bacterium]|nr:hypothetical protein [bacterium]